MTILDDSYEQLKWLAIEKYNCNKVATDINCLKELFTADINSERCLGYITDLALLITVLEKRAVLSPLNVEGFYLIYSALQLKHELIDKHSELLKITQDCVFTRKYDSDIIKNESTSTVPEYLLNNLQHNESGPHSKPSSVNVEQLPTRVIDTVCRQIGHSWKSLARYLKVVQECKIEDIEKDSRTVSDEERAKLVLDEFQRKEDSSHLKTRLLKALKLAGRKDIHDQIEKCF